MFEQENITNDTKASHFQWHISFIQCSAINKWLWVWHWSFNILAVLSNEKEVISKEPNNLHAKFKWEIFSFPFIFLIQSVNYRAFCLRLINVKMQTTTSLEHLSYIFNGWCGPRQMLSKGFPVPVMPSRYALSCVFFFQALSNNVCVKCHSKQRTIFVQTLSL